MVAVVSSSPAETERLGASLADELRSGDVVAVSGDLGAGKTTFIRGACAALGVASRVTSPTFTIGHRYSGDPDVAHLDLYRFESMSAAEWADIEPLLDDAIAFVEWPDVGLGFLPEPRATVTLRHTASEERREVDVDSGDAKLVSSLERTLREGPVPG